jgi:ubiquinone/menaquinone biosynthesis C-methylase UbiE
MERILDLGCGKGDSWRSLGLNVENWRVIGIDIRRDRVQAAHLKYNGRGWSYLCARGENIPLHDGSVNGVFCNVALPYMHIPSALAELHRVLVPGGWLKASLHAPRFTWSEFRRAFPRPKASLFRAFVFFNGMAFHFSGSVISLGKTAESCQTEGGMRIAMRSAGFTELSFRNEGPRFFMDARREGASAAAEAETLEPVA